MNAASDFEPDAHAAYERRDVNIRAVLWLGVAVAAGTVAAMVGLWVLVNGLERQAAWRDPQVSPLAREPLSSEAPLLQPRPVQDFAAFRARQEQDLTSYGWVDRDKQVVRIPIERAKELLLERGEPQSGADKNGERNE